MQVKGELGILDERAVDAAFQRLLPAMQGCLEKGTARVELLGGRVEPFVRIAEDGSVRWAYLKDSTLGDRATESCILDAVRSARWPKPDGGEGQASKPFEFDPPDGTRPPVDWTPDRVRGALQAVQGKLDACKRPEKGHLRATAYVGTDGAPMAVGVAAPDAAGEKGADCVADVLRTMKLPSPGSWPAKVTFEIE
jgi:hypothetical protein